MWKKIIFLFFTILLFSCKKEVNNEELKLVIGFIPHVQFTPLYAGIEKNIFNKYGIDLKIDYGLGVDSFALLKSNKADIALSDSDQLIISNTKNQKLLVLYQYYQKSPVSIITLKGIDFPEDLIGKKIGVPELFGTSFVGANKFIDQFDLNNKTELIRIGYTQITSLLSGNIDAAVCFYNNEPIQLKTKGYNINEWRLSDISNFPGGAFITGEVQLENKKATLENFRKAVTESIMWVNSNKSEALDISYKTIGSLNKDDREYWEEVLNRTLELIIDDDGSAGEISTEKYVNTMDELLKLKLIDKKINIDSIIVR